jgi:hypothetical protein
MDDVEATWQSWSSKLVPSKRVAAEALRRQFEALRAADASSYEAVFAAMDELDGGGDVKVSGVDVGWVVMESGEDGSPAGRRLSGLHEDLLVVDPSGRDGADLWG